MEKHLFWLPGDKILSSLRWYTGHINKDDWYIGSGRDLYMKIIHTNYEIGTRRYYGSEYYDNFSLEDFKTYMPNDVLRTDVLMAICLGFPTNKEAIHFKLLWC